jgi:bifunctional non-homologous end joining protein LigD
MSLRERTRPGLRIIEPCLPSPAKAPPAGPGWIHEIKHDGFRILAQHNAAGIRLITRAGNDFSSRFPFIATAVAKLPVRSCLIDGEAIVCDENGLAVFELIRQHDAGEHAVLCAFDLLELDGRDLRWKPIETRKELLAKLLEDSDLLCIARLVGSAVRALCRNGLARFIAVAVHRFGSRSRTQMLPR